MTTTRHHPSDDALLEHAAGTLAGGPARVLACHLELCAECRARLQTLEAVGGFLLETIEPMAVSPTAFAAALAAIDMPLAEHTRATQAPTPAMRRPALPTGMQWPRSLEDCRAAPWRWLGPGVRWSRVTLPEDRAANLFLLRVSAGCRLPSHTHSECEWTQVLYGAFEDRRAQFAAGDFDSADCDVRHQPGVRVGTECICLTAVEGRLRFDSALAHAVVTLAGM